jgi:uncharacterized protein Yka (UPF0111/DUF47 family)
MFTLLKNIARPQKNLFYNLLNEYTSTLTDLISSFKKYLNESNYSTSKEILQTINQLDKEIEVLTHRFYIELSKNYVTPYDREDLHGLIKSLKYIGEYFRIVSDRIDLYKVNVNDSSLMIYSLITIDTTETLLESISELNKIGKAKVLINKIKEINLHLNDAKDVYLNSIEKIFDENEDIKMVIKKREILIMLEEINHQIKECIQFLESIIIKYT